MTNAEIFSNFHTIAVVGMSKTPGKAANSVPLFFLEKDYNVIPVNPSTTEIGGRKCFASLMEIPDQIDIVNVFRPSEDALAVVESAIERHLANGDVKLIWLQEGIINNEAKALAESNGIEFIQDKCMYKEYFKQ